MRAGAYAYSEGAVERCASNMLNMAYFQTVCLVRFEAQVLTSPTYMEDHLAVLDEDISAGAVPLPQLPMHKQVGRSCNVSCASTLTALLACKC